MTTKPTIAEEIKKLEEIAGIPPTNEMGDVRYGIVKGRQDVAKQALAIIKKQSKMIDEITNYVNKEIGHLFLFGLVPLVGIAAIVALMITFQQ